MNIQVSSSIEIKIEETVYKLSREDAYTLFNALKNQLNECTVPINAPTTAPNYPWYVPNYPAPMWYSSNNAASNNVSVAN
jgi:hypothetical protein